MTDLEQIKERVDIVELIQGYLRLQKAGTNYKAVCPFHNEKTPSFMVSPARQIWHCFGCGSGGDHFKFLMQIEGIEFPEALEILAKRAGVKIKNFDRKSASDKDKLYEIAELASKFFERQLWDSNNGKLALGYLKERELSDGTIKDWRLGFAPNTWNSLRVFLRNGGFSDEQIFKTGLTVQSKTDYYDRFRGRIMFPILDINSRVVGFTGRVFEEVTGEIEAGKYINIPQTLIYDKSKILYGLDKARLDMRKSDSAIVVEGNLDVIMSHQAGVKNAVASSGTALTGWHLKILKRYTQNLNLCFDRDAAGETAAKRGINLALSQGFNIGLISLSAKDPADLAKEDPAKWAEASTKIQPVIQFYIEKAIERFDPKTASGKKSIAGEVLPVLKIIENKVEQAHWLDEVALKLRVDPKILSQAMESIKIDSTTYSAERELETNLDLPQGRLVLEETLLALLFKMPEKSKEVEEEKELEIFQDKLYNNIFKQIKSGDTGINSPLSYEDSLRLELVKFKSDEYFGDLEQKDLESEVSRLIKSLKKELILEKIKDLEIKIKETKNQSEVPSLLQEVQKFSNKLSSLI